MARSLSGRPRPAWPATARRGVGHERTLERSPFFGHAAWHGRRQCYSGGGGAKDSARAPTAERLPTGQGGGGNSSLELLVDGEGETNRIGGGVLR
jgi:hypothetical protein